MPRCRRAGQGAKSLGRELAGTEAFAQCQVEKVFRNVCFRPPSDADDRARVDRDDGVVQANGYNLKTGVRRGGQLLRGRVGEAPWECSVRMPCVTRVLADGRPAGDARRLRRWRGDRREPGDRPAARRRPTTVRRRRRRTCSRSRSTSGTTSRRTTAAASATARAGRRRSSRAGTTSISRTRLPTASSRWVRQRDSRMVTKVAGGHNCWLASTAACADILTTWISNWAGATAGGSVGVELEAPPLRDPGASKSFPAAPDLVRQHGPSAARGILRRAATRPPRRLAAAVLRVGRRRRGLRGRARRRSTSTIPRCRASSLRLRNEFHNCWSDCAANANAMEAAIQAFAAGRSR